ncbi:MAG: 4Fe-4S binding protein [Coriobacteriales bacterium]|nr:4Fe-4S binding protein [Coriobacteriales bacterium]
MAVDEATLKGGGFIKLREPEIFAVRIKIPVGDATAEQLRAISRIADDFGDGTVHLTVRQCLEVRGVRAESFDAVHAALAAAGLGTGACGPRVRVPVSCPGSTFCKRGLNDTRALAAALDASLYGRGDLLPHKFKIGVTGCSASCAKPQENDVGFQGAVRPVFDELEGACIACGVCADACPTGAITLDAEGRPHIDLALCDHDGRCVQACPTRAIRAEAAGWRVFLGGCFGKNPRLGVLAETFIDDHEALRIADSAVDAYRRLGVKGERLRDTMDRVGHDHFIEEVLG